jgi:hypothetical protein
MIRIAHPWVQPWQVLPTQSPWAGADGRAARGTKALVTGAGGAAQPLASQVAVTPEAMMKACQFHSWLLDLGSARLEWVARCARARGGLIYGSFQTELPRTRAGVSGTDRSAGAAPHDFWRVCSAAVAHGT